MSIQVKAATAGARAVVKKAKPAIEFAPNADPPLNPNQPNHNKAAPKAVSITLIGFIATLLYPVRLPTRYARTKPAKPPFICTTVPPAKSRAPASNKRAPSPPHTICVIGAYTTTVQSATKTNHVENFILSMTEPEAIATVMAAKVP